MRRHPLQGDVLLCSTRVRGIVDCRHFGSAVLVGKSGEIIWELGNPRKEVFERSTVKPFRAVAVIQSGAGEMFALSQKELALIAGSHSGTKEHLAVARGLLRKLRISESSLLCGVRPPLGRDAIMAGLPEVKSPLYNECSGEHLGVLAACAATDRDTHAYTAGSHPVQKYFRKCVDSFAIGTIGPRRIVRDACGMPTMTTTLTELAAKMVTFLHRLPVDEDVNRIASSILQYPYIYSGKGRVVGELIAASKGEIIGKCGAEGLYVIGWRRRTVALAVKVADGNHRGAIPVIKRCASENTLYWPKRFECDDMNGFGTLTVE